MAAVVSPPALAGESTMDITKEEEKPLPELPNSSHRVLTPPTSEDNDKRDGNSSELSDLEDDEDDDIGEITPDHYWDEENGGKIPVFKPTMDQFRSFKKFVDKINHYGMKSGIVKIIPPQEWRDSLPALNEAIKTIKVKNPITQEFAGTHGTYTQANIEKQRSYNLPQWKTLTEESNHQTPPKKGERRREAPTARSRQPRSGASTPAAAADGQKRKPGRPRKHPLRSKEEDVPTDSIESEPTQVPPTPTSPERVPEDVKGDATPVKGRAKAKPKPRARQPKSKDVAKSVSSRRMNNQHEVNEIDEEAFEGFDYHLDHLDEFDKERCQELEETYWKTLNFGTPMYGADMPGSLFDERTTSWNVAHLENLLDVLGTKVPGVNTAYLYLGMWKATFAWHLEDVDLYSINYIHFGAPKQWYSISQEDARRFETAMRTVWPQDYKHCDQFLRHKTYLISPEKLRSQFNIKVNKLVHYEGEFVITYPYGYHSGFNLGYNCAESVNFATDSWLEYGTIAKKCECEADSVWVDVHEIQRKLRGEPTPEFIEVTDDEGSDDDEGDVAPVPAPGKPKAPTRKRKRPDEKTKDASKRKVKRIKIRLRPQREPCVLCPNDVTFDVLLPTDNGKQAHRVCALYTPETYLVYDEDIKGERVCAVANINKARLDLKCNFCRSKKGSCFQCASKKCTRAFHATCAAAAGVLVDEGPVPTWDEDGTEYYYDGFDFRCRFHRPRRPKTTTVDSLEDNKLVRQYAKGLEKGDVVQGQYIQGEVFAGTVVENRHTETAVLIDYLPEGDRVEVEWKYLLVLDQEQSLRPKPSPEAKPLPEHLNHKENVNASNRQDGVPEIGDPFHDPDAGQKWAEWNAANTAEVRNPFQKHVDLSKSEQLWHYLGKTSTEARPQYTHDPAKKVHNPKSNFLETVRPPAPRPIYPPQRTSYPTPYSTSSLPGPNGVGHIQRPQQQVQPQLQPQSLQRNDKPYQYKPKTNIQPNVYNQQHPYQWGAQQDMRPNPSYPPTTRPVAPAPQYPQSRPSSQSHPGPTSSYHQQTPPNPYAPPAHSPPPPRPRLDNSPPQPNFYEQVEKRYSQQQPMNSRYQTLASPKPTPPQPTKAAPVANMVGPTPLATAVFTPPSQRSHSNSVSMRDYISHITKYPYLRAAYARRPKEYISPYAPGGGFTPVYIERMEEKLRSRSSSSNSAEARRSSSTSSTQRLPPPTTSTTPSYSPAPVPARSQSPYAPYHAVPPVIPRSQMISYQSPQDFQRQVSREGEKVPLYGGAKWDALIRNLQQSSPSSSSSASPTPQPQPNSGGPSTPYAQHPQPQAQQRYDPAPSSSTPIPAPIPQYTSAPTSYVQSQSQSQHQTNNQQPYSLPPLTQMTRTNSGSGYAGVRSPPRPDYSPISEHATPRPVAIMQPQAQPQQGPARQPIGLGLEGYKTS